jgi:3-methyladenine DNA glycosylase Mpg
MLGLSEGKQQTAGVLYRALLFRRRNAVQAPYCSGEATNSWGVVQAPYCSGEGTLCRRLTVQEKQQTAGVLYRRLTVQEEKLRNRMTIMA